MRDFTFDAFSSLLTAFSDAGYIFQPFCDYIDTPGSRSVILRHDVDSLPENSLRAAKIENDLGISGTFFFRITPRSFNKEIIRQISAMGHEIGYHYEDMSGERSMGDRKGSQISPEERAARAIVSFKRNLDTLRDISPVKTICMHGSPLSRWDSRQLWKYYDYRSFAIIGEPYFDLNLDDMLYLTDTGRRWDGDSVSVRDRLYMAGVKYYDQWKVKPQAGSALSMTEKGMTLRDSHIYRTTKEIMHAAANNLLPARLMITFHPQRWNDKLYAWVQELAFQNTKNLAKFVFIKLVKNARN